MRKKLICLAAGISFILTLLIVPPAASADAGADGIVRVKLSVGTTASLSFFIDGNYGVAGNDAVALERQLYTVKLEGGSLNLYYGGTKLCGGATLTLAQHAATPGRNNFIWLKWSVNDSTGYAGYPGDMEFTAGGGGISAVSHVYIEDYLCGVVPYEMSNSWPVEALKAQAVAARNYVAAKMGGSGAYDVVDTTTDQVYRGYNAQNANAIQAVEQTANTVLTCGGQLVQIFYSASNGGYTEIPQHVWTAAAPLQPYQIIRQDTFDTQNPYSLQEVLIFPKAISASAPIAYQYSSGGAMAAGTGGEGANAGKYLKDLALPVVAALGTYACASTADFEIAGVTGIAPHTYMDQHDIKDYAGNNPCVCFQQADVGMNVLVKRKTDGGQETVPLTVTMDLTQLVSINAFDQPASVLRMFTVEQTDGDWRIWHRRYGHGVGLSQRGAEQRAKSGDPEINTYQKILGFYFPDTAYTTLAYSRPALTPIAPPDSSNAAVACPGTTLNVRSSPDSSGTGNLLGSLPDGARLCVAQQNAATGWHRIVYGGRDAYVSADYVRLDAAGGADPTPTSAPTQPPSAVLRGDVNGDGAITISDYTLVRLSILGIKPLTGDALAAADVNGDGAVSISDYTLIRLNILGIKSIG